MTEFLLHKKKKKLKKLTVSWLDQRLTDPAVDWDDKASLNEWPINAESIFRKMVARVIWRVIFEPLTS